MQVKRIAKCSKGAFCNTSKGEFWNTFDLRFVKIFVSSICESLFYTGVSVMENTCQDMSVTEEFQTEQTNKVSYNDVFNLLV